MTQNYPRNTAAGFRNHFLGFTDEDGVLLGNSPVRPAAGLSSGMLRLWAAKRAAATVPNPDVVIAEGDDGEVLTEYQFRSIASRGFLAEVAVQDLQNAGRITNVPVRNVGRGQFVVVDRSNAPTYNCTSILQSRSVDIITGAQQWAGVIIPRATATYLGRAEFNERTPAVYRFWITPLPAGWSPLGYTFLDSDGVQTTAFYDEFKGYPNPITMAAFTGDGLETDIQVDLRPVSAAASVLAVTPPSGQGATAAVVASVTNLATPYSINAQVAPTLNWRAATLYEFTAQ
jgi:hypothetical protein